MGEAETKLKAFLAAHKGKTLTDAQKESLVELRKDAGVEKFRRLGNIRLTRALAAIDGLSSLARLPHTAEQVKKLRDTFNAALSKMIERFEAKTKPGDGAKKTLEIL